jgi:hypothetical protein
MTREQIHAPETSAIRAFLTAHFVGQSGWLCLGWINGDPKVEPLRETWFELPRQLTDAIQCAQTLAECQYNLYVAPCLFRERTRGYATALPSAWLWLDDVAIAEAELVESSAGNYQSWLPLDRPLAARERSQLQRALRDSSAGADACSADAVHMARLPGGWNRKRQDAWQVRLAREAEPPQSVDELRTRFPCADEAVHVEVSGDWGALQPGDVLAHSQRFLALARANEQLGRLLADESVGIDCSGYRDTSRSARRAIFVCQLLRARYPHDEIRALATAFMELLDSGRGLALFQRDIDRLLAKYTPAAYLPQTTRAVRVAVVADRPTGGRPITLTAEALLAFYHQYADCGVRGIVLEWTRAEVARHLGVSVDTIQRREGELIAAGHLRREISADRQRSFVILSPTTWDVDAQVIPVPDCADATLPTSPASVSRTDAEETHHPAVGREAAETAVAENSEPTTNQGITMGERAAAAPRGVYLSQQAERKDADRAAHASITCRRDPADDLRSGAPP